MTELAAGAAAAVAALSPDEREGGADLVADRRARRRAARARSRPSSLPAGEALRAAELHAAGGRRPTCARFLDSLEAEPGRLEEVEAELDRLADLRRRYRAQSLRRAARARGEQARRELDALAEGHDPVARGRRSRRGRAGRGRPAPRRAARPRAREAAPRVRGRRSPRSSPASGWARASSASTSATRDPGPSGADEVAFLGPAERRPPVRAGRGDRLRRRALARSRSRSRPSAAARRWSSTRSTPASAARPPTPSARRSAASPARAQVVTITHLPQIASLADRHFRVEKVPGDPTHTRIEPLDGDERRDELERMLGGADFLAMLAGGEMASASRELLASRDDVWGFLAEPNHLSDWWPGAGVAAGPARLRAGGALAGHGDLRSAAHRAVALPALRPATGPSAARTLVIKAIEPRRLWSFELHRQVKEGSDKGVTPRTVTVALRPLTDDTTEVGIEVTTGSREESDLAQMAADRLYDLVQMAATL